MTFIKTCNLFNYIYTHKIFNFLQKYIEKTFIYIYIYIIVCLLIRKRGPGHITRLFLLVILVIYLLLLEPVSLHPIADPKAIGHPRLCCASALKFAFSL